MSVIIAGCSVTGSYIQKKFQYKCMQNILSSAGKESNWKMTAGNLKKCEKKCFKIQYMVY